MISAIRIRFSPRIVERLASQDTASLFDNRPPSLNSGFQAKAYAQRFSSSVRQQTFMFKLKFTGEGYSVFFQHTAHLCNGRPSSPKSSSQASANAQLFRTQLNCATTGPPL